MITKNVPMGEVFKGEAPLTFGEVLRSWRLAEEMSQTQMARRLKISRANLCDIEKGRKIPTPIRAVKIAKKLGMVEARAVESVLQDLLKKDRLKFKVSVAA